MTFPTPSSPARRRNLLAVDRRPNTADVKLQTANCKPRTAPAFTLTEVLIALALISFLLVGISRIFAMMSSTISTGQGVSTALRSHKAVGQSLSADFLGYSSRGRIEKSDDNSGMTPLVISPGSSGGAPFLMINNFRTPAFLNEAAARTAISQPVASDTYDVASLKIRRIDLNGDGTITNSSTAAGGEVVPLYYYGDRNFRCDTISFFGKGSFQSQTGSASAYITDISSRDSWFWYGHLRVFNGDIANVALSASYGLPTSVIPTSGESNRNNQYAEQFILGRVQGLLVEPEVPSAGGTDKTVLTASGDPVYFLGRRWNEPSEVPTGGGADRRDVFTPFYYNSGGFGGSYVQAYNGSSGNNAVNFATDSAATNAAANSRALTYHTRTDIIGSGIDSLRERVKVLEALRPRNDILDWWANAYANWGERPWVNPYTSVLATDAPKALARRVPLLAEGCSQFVVEYAGDFIGQAANGTRTSIVPDGVLDFAAVPNASGSGFTHQIRWYGMPRDVDGDGIIKGSIGAAPPAAVMQSPDVIYLRDIRGQVSDFERPASVNPLFAMPDAAADYHLLINERNAPNDFVRQNATRYTCAWGVSEFETPTATIAGKAYYDVPQLIRIIVEMRDQKGRLSEPVTQEYVFPVKVSE